MADDDTAKFRILTVRFLQRDLGKLTEIEKALADDPKNHSLRSVWLQELREYRDRVSRLYDEWQFRYKDTEESSDPERVTLGRITRKTPIDVDE